MGSRLRDQIVVITGASSGIGRATALLFARHGARVVLAARSRRSLEEAAVECERGGAPALIVPTDVRDEGAVCDLARLTIERYGRIDVWVNCAGVLLLARFGEAPSDVYRQVLETNLFGVIHGTAAALPWFQKQGRGTLINISSILGEMGMPSASAYCASKFAIRGLGESLRDELRRMPGIHVCTVLPSAIDTPIYQKAANYTGRVFEPQPPIYRPEKVARAIVRLTRRPRAETVVGGAGRALVLAHRIAPSLTARLVTAVTERRLFRDQPAPPTAGNVCAPMPQWDQVSGGWARRGRRMRLLRLAVRGITLALPSRLIKLLRR